MTATTEYPRRAVLHPSGAPVYLPGFPTRRQHRRAASTTSSPTSGEAA